MREKLLRFLVYGGYGYGVLAIVVYSLDRGVQALLLSAIVHLLLLMWERDYA